MVVGLLVLTSPLSFPSFELVFFTSSLVVTVQALSNQKEWSIFCASFRLFFFFLPELLDWNSNCVWSRSTGLLAIGLGLLFHFRWFVGCGLVDLCWTGALQLVFFRLDCFLNWSCEALFLSSGVCLVTVILRCFLPVELDLRSPFICRSLCGRALGLADIETKVWLGCWSWTWRI